jgi:hypothetical protein
MNIQRGEERMPSARHLRPRPVVSRSTVLILAGFLIGFSLSGAIEDGLLRTQIFICGIVGMISFIGLDFVARRRAQVIADLLRDEEAEQMRQVAESLTNVRESLRARALELDKQPDAKPRAIAGKEGAEALGRGLRCYQESDVNA